MKINVWKRYIYLTVSLFALFSCVDNLDFDQIEYSATPIYNAPIISFDLTQNNFIDPNTNTDITNVSDDTDFTYLESSLIRDNLERVELNFEINNQFDERSFTIFIEFLDENNTPTHPVINFTVQPNQLLIPPVETILISTNQNFLRTRRVRIRAEMSTGTSALNPNIIQHLSFKSAGTFYVRT